MNVRPVDVVLTVFERGELNVRKAFGHVRKVRTDPAVARKVPAPALYVEHETAPERLIPLEAATREMK